MQTFVEHEPVMLKSLSHDEINQLQLLVNHYPIDFKTDDEESLFQHRLKLASEGKISSNVWLFRSNDVFGNVIGWTMFSVCHDDVDDSAYSYAGFYVKHTHRRLGIGSDLYKKVYQWAVDNNIKEIRTQPWNSQSRSFFKSVGCVVKNASLCLTKTRK